MLRDIQYSIRSLLRAPLFTAIALISLALGIGANTSIFTITDQVLLRLLPVQDPRSIVQIATAGAHTGSNRGRNTLSYPMYKDYRDRSQVFDGVVCTRSGTLNLTYQDSTERAEAELVSGNYFQVLGVPAALGRLFSPQDESAPGANPVVVLDYEYWQRRFAGDRGILGKPLRVNNSLMTVVGVAAPDFNGLQPGFQPLLYIPVTMKKEVTPSWDDLDNRRSRWLSVYARLKPGITREKAEAAIRTLYRQIISQEVREPYFAHVPAYAREQFLRSYAVVLPGGQGDSGMRRAMDMPLRVLMGLVGVVLLIACANVSNLLVARSAGRQREVALRMSLGASRGRIVRQLLVESFLLAGTAGVIGIAMSYWTTKALLVFAPNDRVRMAISPVPDERILLFSMAISALAAFLFGLLPALQSARTDLVTTLKEQAGSIAHSHGRVRRALVAAQVSLSFLLLVASGLFVQSLWNLKSIHPGFDAANLIRFKLSPQLSGYDVPRTHAFFDRLQKRLSSAPGVKSAGLASVAIMEGNEWTSTVTIEGYRSKDGEDMNPHFNSISAGYFPTLGMRLVAGRDFDERDRKGAKEAVIVNQTFAKRYFGDRSPLGYHFGFGSGPDVKLKMEIVGVVQDAKYENLRNEIPRQVFVCEQQSEFSGEMTAYVRTNLPSEQMFAAVRREVGQLDATMPLYDLLTMDDQLDRSLSIERFVSFLSGAFGWLATALAIIGLYGVTAYSVARRSSEIGIRMAMGARPGDVMKLVLRETMMLSSIGIAVSLPLAWWLTKLIKSQLYGLDARDPKALVLSVLGLLTAAFAAGALPAWRAARTDPVKVLRSE